MQNSEPGYPIVKCPHHKKQEPGYMICRHVLTDGESPEKVKFPTSTELGLIVCSRSEHSKEDFSLICAECAKEKGFIKLN